MIYGTSFSIFIALFVFEVHSLFRSEISLYRPYNSIFHGPDRWVTLGSAIVSEESIILTTDTKSQKGSIWLTKPIDYLNWKVDIEFKISGIGNRFYGDGLAFWYISKHSTEGPVFGSHDYFKGLGVMFDTYSNHQDLHQHNHPYISAQVNDGTIHYDHDSDGTLSQVDGCSANFRGKNFFAQIAYYGSNKTLVILTKESHIMSDYITCFKATDIELPTGYYIGLSSITGDLSDNHEIISLRFSDMDDTFGAKYDSKDYYNINPRARESQPTRVHKQGPPASTKSWRILKRILLMILVLILSGICIFGILVYINKRQKDRMKRFY